MTTARRADERAKQRRQVTLDKTLAATAERRGAALRDTRQPKGQPGDSRAAAEASAEEEQRPVLTPEDELLALGLDGPVCAIDAPLTLRLPAILFEAILAQLDAARADGREHGALFGATPLARLFAVAYVDGEAGSIDYSPVGRQWPTLVPAGTFHTHLWELIDIGSSDDVGWAGGAHSDQDLLNLLQARHHVSAVVAQTKNNGLRTFLLVRPQTFTLVESPEAFVADYRRRVLARVAAGADQVEASEYELRRLSRRGSLVLYSGGEAELTRR